MSSNNYGGQDDSRGRGGQKRGGTRGGQRGGGGGDYPQQQNTGRGGYRGGQQSSQGVTGGGSGVSATTDGGSKYVKKGNNNNQKQQQQQYQQKQPYQQQQQYSQQDLIDQMNQMAEEQYAQQTQSNLSADEKFQMMVSGQLFDQQTQQQEDRSVVEERDDPYNEEPYEESKATNNQAKQPRLRVGRELLLSKFQKRQEINLSYFEKDVLDWLEVFSNVGQEPEVNQPIEAPAESVTLQSAPARRGGAGPPRGGYGGAERQRQIGGTQWRGDNRRPIPPHGIEEEENEEDPEWVDFDPKKDTGSFFGRSIQNEDQMRENVKKEKERQRRMYGEIKTHKQLQEDEFDRLVKEKEEEQLQREEKQLILDREQEKQIILDKDLEKQLEEVVKDIELGERNYSDIDLIYEKNALKQKQQSQQAQLSQIKSDQKQKNQVLNDDEITDLFTQLIEAEDEKKRKQQEQLEMQQKQEQIRQQQIAASAQQQAAQQQQQQQQQQKVQLPQQLQEQIQNLTLQQQQKIQQQKILSQAKPKFTALQNVQNLFANLPVVAHEKHRIKMQDIAEIEIKQKEESQDKEEVKDSQQSGSVGQGYIFKELMASINPFSKYIIEESLNQSSPQQGALPVKNWQLENSIFQRPVELVKPETLQKTSSEMFVIYKYFSDPLMKVRSQAYTEDKFVQIKELFPTHNLMEVSPLSIQLMHNTLPQPQQQAQMNMIPGIANMAASSFNTTATVFVPQRKLSSQPNEGQQQQEQTTPTGGAERELQKVPISLEGQGQFESLEDGEESEEEEKAQEQTQGAPSGRDLNSMESQLKSMLGFNPR